MTTWQDRVPTYPNRYKITRADGSTEFVTLQRADEPITEGTPINAANLNALERAIENKLDKDADFSTLTPVSVQSNTGSFNDFFVQGKMTLFTCVAGLIDAPNSDDSFTVMTNGHGAALSGQQIAWTVSEPVKMYARRYENGTWSGWTQYVAAEFDSSTNTLNIIM